MKSEELEGIRIWEKCIYYLLAGLDHIVYFFYRLLRRIMIFFFKAWCVLTSRVHHKNQQSPFSMLKSQQACKKTLLLDLDGTLISTSTTPNPVAFKIQVNGEYLYVLQRPFLQEFIKEVGKYFLLGVYTSSIESYADKVIAVTGLAKAIPKNMRFYRNSCEYLNGNYMKRVSKVEADLRNVMILDNRPEVVYDKKNIIKIDSWMGGEDFELIRCLDRLKKISSFDDIRIGCS